MSMKKLLAALLVLLPSLAHAQVLQSGNVTPGHIPYWVTDNVIGDGGTAASPVITSFGVTNNGGPGICVNSDIITNPYNQICLAASTSAPGVLSLQNYNGAAPQALNFIVNGVTFAPVTVSGGGTLNNVPCFSSPATTLVDCTNPNIKAATGTSLILPLTGLLLGNNTTAITAVTPVASAVLVTSGASVPSLSTTLPSGLSATNMTLTTPTIGAVTSTGTTGTGLVVFATAPSVSSLTVTAAFTATGLVTNADLANPATTVNGQTCTLGSTCTITASAGTITPGVTTVASGTTKGLLYNNAGTLGNLASGVSGVLVTDASSVPSISTTLPSGLSAASFTVTTAFTATGLVTNADLATMLTNTVKANVTSGTASPTDFAVSSCDTATKALGWTTNTGFVCNSSITAAAVPASGLTGATLASGVTASSLTSVGTLTSLTTSGQITSTVSTGTAPFVVASATTVANLSAASLNGATFTAPGPIGSVTASTGAFTTLSASSTVSGTGFSTYLASPPAIGTTAPAAGKFTTLVATGTVNFAALSGGAVAYAVCTDASGYLVANSSANCYPGGTASAAGSTSQVQYNSSGSLAAAAGFFFTSPGTLTLGQAGTSVGGLALANATSGAITLAPTTGALGSVTATLPANTGTIAELNLAQTWTAAQTFTNSDIKLLGSSTGATTLTSANAGASNFTLTLPAATDTVAVLGTAQTFTAAQTFTDGDLLLKGSTSGSMTLKAPAIASTYTMTFPAATDTVAVLGTAQTFTATQTFTNSFLRVLGSSTGATSITSANSSATNYTLSLPAVTDTLATLSAADQPMSGGVILTAHSYTAGNITIDCGFNPVQYVTGSTSAWVITAPASDGTCLLLLTNPGSSVNIPTFSGFTVGASTGDALDATASHKFTLSIWRINGVSSYVVKALQ